MNSAGHVEQVILVHGTFASSDNDIGDAWWQVDSKPYRELKRRLPAGVKLAESGRVFHWSGENHERARSKAARQLLNFLRPLEESGTRYHLVGHSHGGSVIWSALRTATLRKQKLSNLGSWSTVGTPFLHQATRSPFGLINICYSILAAFLLVSDFKALWFLIKLPFKLAIGNLQGALIIHHDTQVNAVAAILRAPILKGLELADVPLTKVTDGIQLGSFDPNSGQSLAAYFFGSREGFLIFGAILLFAYVTTLLLSLCAGPVCEVFRGAWEKRLEKKAFENYGGLWLGVWTPQDEAINGLSKTLEISVSFVGNLAQRERIYISDFLSLPLQPLLFCAAPFYNRIMRPVLDSTIRKLVVKAAQGNNRPSAEVVAVSPHPVDECPGDEAPPLPDWLSEKILELADRHAQDLGPKLRKFLGQPLLHAGLEKFSASLSGRELVHTSYFDHPEVIDLLAVHINQHQRGNPVRRRSAFPQVKEWYSRFHNIEHPHTTDSEHIDVTTMPSPNVDQADPEDQQLQERQAA